MAQDARYILSKRIARGGMAEIFLGKAIGNDDVEKICAIKRILPHHAHEKEFVEMFRAEAGICKRLQHPNIVQVFDFKKVDGNYAIIMEFVNGTDLRSLLAACEKAKMRMTVPMIVYFTALVARGLHFAHSKTDDATGKPLGIVHRDISPQNILIGYEGEVKVIDFGIANYEAKNMETKPGIVKGKYSYMSPEQVTAKKLDARTDIFSLAIVLWEALAMKRLFAADTEVETIRNVQHCIIKFSLAELNKSVDPGLQEIIMRGLDKDRKMRYQSCGAFDKDLMKYLESHFPEFKPSMLGDFVKQVMGPKRNEIQHDIQKLLSMPATSFMPDTEPNTAHSGTLPGADHKMPMSQHESVQFTTNSFLPEFRGKHTASKSFNIVLGNNETISKTPLASPHNNQQKAPMQTSRGASNNPRASYAQMQQVQQQMLAQRLASAQSAASMRRARSGGNNLILFLGASAAVFLITFGLMYVKQTVMARKDTMQYLVQATPPNVKLKLNNKPLFNGNYVRTPLKMTIPAGNHELVIARQAYLAQKMTIKGGPGDLVVNDKIALLPDPAIKRSAVRFEADPAKKFFVVVDKGLYKGFLPLTVNDLSHGKSHTLMAYPHYRQKKGAFKCTFVPKSEGEKNPLVLSFEYNPATETGRCVAKPR
jgi:serine/threonine protein kinase